MKRYLENHVNEDGGVGLHIEGHSTMFGSVLTHVALRCLGEELESSETLRKCNSGLKHEEGRRKPELGEVLVSDAGMLRVERFESNSPRVLVASVLVSSAPGALLVSAVEWYIYPCPICTANAAAN